MRQNNSPWIWIPTLYFAQGVPNAFITFVLQVMFLAIYPDIKNTDLTFWTGLLLLPWSFKFIWAPILDLLGTKKNWIIWTQVLMGIAFLLSGFLLPVEPAIQCLIGIFLAIGFISATCDIASDGYYMIQLTEPQQAFFSGIRNTFFRVANITIRSGVIIIAAFLMEQLKFSSHLAWGITLGIIGLFFILIALYHGARLQKDTISLQRESHTSIKENILSFIQKKHIISLVLFIFLYRFAEAQLGGISTPFLVGSIESGGLGLGLNELGIIYGTLGVIAMLVGGILGGVLISKYGLGKLLWPMVFALNIPDLFYLFLAQYQPNDRLIIGACVVLEQFGYGFGFASFMLILVYFADNSGKYKTSHYAFLSGMMVASTILPNMISGKIADFLGYTSFFAWVNIATLVSFFSVWLISNKIDPLFGKKNKIN